MKIAIRIVLGLMVVLALVFAAALGLGALQPRRHRAVSSALIPAPPDSVWAAITDWEHSPAWRTDVKSVVRLPDRNGHPVWNQLSDDGTWPLEITESAPPEKLIAVVADSSQGFGGSWTYRLAPEGGGTRVTIVEDGFVDHPLFRFMARYFFGFHSTQQGYLMGLGRRFRANVKPRIDR